MCNMHIRGDLLGLFDYPDPFDYAIVPYLRYSMPVYKLLDYMASINCRIECTKGTEKSGIVVIAGDRSVGDSPGLYTSDCSSLSGIFCRIFQQIHFAWLHLLIHSNFFAVFESASRVSSVVRRSYFRLVYCFYIWRSVSSQDRSFYFCCYDFYNYHHVRFTSILLKTHNSQGLNSQTLNCKRSFMSMELSFI